MSATVFLGGGRITGALVAGLRRRGFRGRLVVHDRNRHKLADLKKAYGVVAQPDLQRAVSEAQLLIVAVRPGSVIDLLQKIRALNRSLVVVSLAAGVPLSRLRRLLGPQVKWVRAMPSPLCRTGKGLTALSFPRGLAAKDRNRVSQLFGKVGEVIEISESQFDAFTVTYSSSHGWHALATLAMAAEKIGLDRNTALTAAAHALGDAITSWRDERSNLKGLINEAATPGGTAAATLAAMNRAGYQRVVERGLRAGLARAKANAKL
jgi:pyrroline-5-carboxylate reductase